MGRYIVKLEDGTTLRLYRQTVEDHGLYAGKELSDSDLKRLMQDAGEMSAKMRAVRIVSATSVSKRDLEHRLVHKGEDPQQAKAVVQWMSELNLLDDKKTAELIVQRCIHKGFGLARAKQALYEKQIPKEFWEGVLKAYPDQTDAIVAYLQDHLEPESNERDKRRAIDALIRRGHSYGVIRKAMEMLSFQTDELPEV